MIIQLKKISADAIIPTKNFGDAGYDLYSTESVILKPLERKLIKTNIALSIPKGYYGKVCDRSGKALKEGLHVMAGVIDSTYRGDVGVVLINLNHEKVLPTLNSSTSTEVLDLYAYMKGNAVKINKGDKIAQIIIQKYEECSVVEVDALDETMRNEKGFGSSGQ